MSSFVLQGAVFPDDSVADVLVVDGAIREIGHNLVAGGVIADEVIDCSDLRILPGFVDLHTHLREPGFEASESILTGSQSAALGGFTAVHAMANTNPVADNAAVVEMVHNHGMHAGYVDVFPIGAVTKSLEGEKLAELGLMNQSTAKVAVFSDDGKCVSDALIMKRALEYVKAFDGVIAQHAQEPRLTEGAQMNDGELSAVLGLKGWPAVAEEMIIARDVLLAESTGSRLHICHLSTAGSVEVIRWAKSRGINVTAEVTPHHLLLTEQLVADYNTKFKVNPPLRKESDVLALREALIDGTIDIIATDHAPHAAELKDCEWSAAAFGMVGLETAASVAQLVLIESKRSSWQRLAEVLSHNPAKIARDHEHGQPLAVGSIANLTLVDATAKRLIEASTASKSMNNPYSGLTLPGSVVHTIFKGRFTVRNSELQSVIAK